MKPNIIKYTTFSTSVEFEEFQIANPTFAIMQIQPIALSLNMEHAQSNDVDSTLHFGIFITYFEKEVI